MPLNKISPRGFLAFMAGCALTVQMASSSLQKFSRPSVPTQTMAASVFAASPLYAQFGESSATLDDETAVDNPLEDIHLYAPSEEEFLTPEKLEEIQPVDDSPQAAIVEQRFAWPVSGSLTSRYGWRGREMHRGIDIGAPYGRTIKAAKGGVVTLSGWYYGYGRTVVIRHADGADTLYGHASRLLVSAGQRVEQGQPVALVGSSGRSTGPHLHFEVRINGRAVNPLPYLGQ